MVGSRSCSGRAEVQHGPHQGKPIFAVCHFPQLLATADAIKAGESPRGRRSRTTSSRMGKNVVDEEVVVDGNLVTSRKPGDLDAFAREAVKVLERVPARQQ
jgi:protease I